MTVETVKGAVSYKGLSTDTKPTGGTVSAYSTFKETDTGNDFEYDGDGDWYQIGTGGASLVADQALNLKIYSGSGYTYYCQSVGGSALTESVWQVMRKTDSDSTITYAGTDVTFGTYAFAADDLATVEALTYNNGV